MWLPERDMIMIDTWDEDNPDESQSSSEDQNPDLLEEISDPKRDQKNTPPTAVDDEFGVRPGKSTLLPVLQNDSDSDGDVLTAEPMSQPSFGSVVVTRGGRALQITGVADDAEGGQAPSPTPASDGPGPRRPRTSPCASTPGAKMPGPSASTTPASNSARAPKSNTT